MSRYGMTPEKRLGVSIPTLRRMAKDLGQDHALALALWKTGIPDARILASMIEQPGRVTEKQMESWVGDFNSWDVCDQICDSLFQKTAWAWKKVRDWAERDEEFVKRAAFAEPDRKES
jgi:3-methyladenine DNA glycosylase AlkD